MNNGHKENCEQKGVCYTINKHKDELFIYNITIYENNAVMV